MRMSEVMLQAVRHIQVNHFGSFAGKIGQQRCKINQLCKKCAKVCKHKSCALLPVILRGKTSSVEMPVHCMAHTCLTVTAPRKDCTDKVYLLVDMECCQGLMRKLMVSCLQGLQLKQSQQALLKGSG